MSAGLLVIVDDNSTAFSYSSSGTPPAWELQTISRWYQATSHIAYFKLNTTFSFIFDGTSAAFIGGTPFRDNLSLGSTVQIDNGTPVLIDYGDPDPPTYKQWFTTPTLPDGRHVITFRDLYRTTIDYAVVKVGNNASLTGQTVIVDDDSPLIQYSGQWSRSTRQFISGGLGDSLGPLKGYPYGNATHTSSNPGDTFTFRFSGMSIAVYGVFSWYNIGSLTMTYSIDGTPYSSSISVNTSSTDYLIGREFSNNLFFHLDNLPLGNHTLLVNVTEANNQTFILDYITYKPFDTPSSSGDSSTTSPMPPVSGSQKSVSTGAIVGGVLGGLAFVVLTTFVILFIRRRRRAREQDYAYHDAALRGGGLNDANILSPSQPASAQVFIIKPEPGT